MNERDLPLHATHDAATTPLCTTRREALKTCACACVAAGLQAVAVPRARADDRAEQRPTRGDRLVAVSEDASPKPLLPADVKLGAKPLQAFPFDPAAKLLRDGSRLNKVLLVRLDPASLDEATRARSAGGVLAFSGVCTHEGCDVSEWVAASNSLLCFCHFSRFDPAQAGQVMAGPASRSLPWLPISVDGGQLVVTGPFSASPGKKAA